MAADLPLSMSPPRNPATVKAMVALVILVRAMGGADAGAELGSGEPGRRRVGDGDGNGGSGIILTGLPPAVIGRLRRLPVTGQSLRTCRAPATGMDSSAATKLPKVPPSQSPIDVPTRMASSTSSGLIFTVRLMTTGFSTWFSICW